MGSQRAHIVLPDDLIQELRRHRLLSFLQAAEPAWDDLQHPELKRGAAAWVHFLRKENDLRPTLKASPRRPRRASFFSIPQS